GEGKDNVTITVTRGTGEGAQTISDLNKLNVGDVITFAPKTGYSIIDIMVGKNATDVKSTGYTVTGDDEEGITLTITTEKAFKIDTINVPAHTSLYFRMTGGQKSVKAAYTDLAVTADTIFYVDSTLVIKPETGYKFTAAPTVGGKEATAGENGEYTYTFTDSDTSTSALNVSATAKKVSKIASIPEGFTVQNSNKETLNKDSEVLEGDELTITPNVTAPDKLNRVVINGTAYGAKESYSFTVGTADVEIKAEIAKPTAIEVVGLKDEYFVGVSQAEAIAGLELTVTYDDGSSEYHVAVTGEMLGDSFSTADDKMSFTITYGTATKSVSVDLTAVAVEKIAVTTDFQRQYTTSDESLVLTGGKLTVYKNNGDTEEIDIADNENVKVEGYAHDKAYANLDLTITYTVDENHKYTTTYSIVVLDASKTVSSIAIADENELKKEYYVGDEFVVGGQITVSYSDADSETIDITSAMVSGYNPQTSGSQTITVTYGGKTTSYEVTVTAVTVTGITVTPPTKTDYKVGESLDLTGGSLVATYNNGKEETLPLTAAGVSVTGFNSAAPAQNQEITVSYGGQNGTFNVNIAEKSYKVNFSNATVKNGETELKTGDSVAENTVLTVAATPKDGYTAALKVNGTAQSGTSATITVINDVTITVEYTKKSSGGSSGSSGGSSGGSSSGGSSSTTKNPTVDGKTQTWTDVASDISKLTDGTTKTINLNGGTTVPVDVVKAIATSNAEVTLEVDEVFSWTIDGSDIDPKDAKAANLSITKTTVTGTSALRGTVGTGFTIKGTNVKSELNINFKATHAGEFANLFKKVDGKLVFVDNVKVDKNGSAIGLEVSEKGEYVVMLGKYSDRAGDMDNDGISNAKDSLAILKDFLDMEKGVNPLVADVNGDGFINAKDALQVLIEYLGIK
ncbi:MAG: bacterial Ig-like domain-containing protein, partial [[Eubacterium] saphenum]|nr:bacterial Ig-like domain-containing protein [[Eubacterium] saphenum]